MLDLINGLPIHPLVVHAVVVVLPLGALGAVATALSPKVRARYGWLVSAALLLSALLIPVATSSGDALAERVGEPEEHAELGEQLLWFALPLLILTGALTWLDHRASTAAQPGAAAGSGADRDGAGSSRLTGVSAQRVLAGLTVIAALAVGVQVYRVGDSGARAVWGDHVSSSNDSSNHDGDDDDH